MIGNNGQPATHSLLRSSQSRRRQQSRVLKKFDTCPNPPNDPNLLQQPCHSNNSNFSNQNSQKMRHSRYENVIVSSVPKIGPKYSTTFDQISPFSGQNMRYQSVHQSLILDKGQGSPLKPQSTNIRKQMDSCLYTITDKLREMQQAQTKNLEDCCLVKQNHQNCKYKLSISQIRKNKKLYLGRSIHRIHPDIVDKYIETVARDYHIPNPLSSQEKRESSQSQAFPENREIPQFQSKQDQKPISTHNFLFKTHLNFIPQQQTKFLNKNQSLQSNTQRICRNNFSVETEHQRQSKKRKNKFLNITLSKEKSLISQKKQSPSSIQRQKQRVQSSINLKQKKMSRQSSSQRKILSIKKNISEWKESQNQFAERYSYLESPYEKIKPPINSILPLPALEKQSLHSSLAQVCVRIRPFQEMMKQTPVVRNSFENIPKKFNTAFTTQQSNFEEQKCRQSFLDQKEVLEQFRFCILCELPVLSANIYNHEEKCVGWIWKQSKLYKFKDLYKIQDQQELVELTKCKIEEISKRLIKNMNKLKTLQQQNATEEAGLAKNIFETVSNFVNQIRYFKVENKENSEKYSSSYRKVQQNYENEYLILLGESQKLHWFVKLLENFESIRRKQARLQKVRQ